MNTSLNSLKVQIKPLQDKLVDHPINRYLNTYDDLKRFMQFHSFAVWDFMSLVKKLQSEFTCTSLPWKPVGNPQTRRLINEIVFGEESDVDQFGNPISHFELYLQAMNELNIPVVSDLEILLEAKNVEDVIKRIQLLQIDNRLKQFLHFTFHSIQTKKIHEIAAIFTFGREDLIPSMFTKIVNHLKSDPSKNCNTLLFYLDRHIEVDGDSHSHLAYDMMEQLCGNDEKKWEEAKQAALDSLHYRILLWDSITSA